MKHNIQLSEVMTIDTPVNRCALAFSMQLQQHLKKDTNTLFLTANKPDLVRANLHHVKQHLPHFETVHEKTTYLFLKEEWNEISQRFGIRAFNNELNKITEEEIYDFYYFHRIDLFFNTKITYEVEQAIVNFIESIRYHHKKVLFSYNSLTASGKIFETLFAHKRDLSFDVVLNDDGECDLTMKTHNRLLQKENARICLISDQSDMHYLHQTILQKQPYIQLDIASLEDLEKDHTILNEETDLILYNDSRKFLTKEMTNVFKKLSPYAQIFWITNRKSIRKSDLNESKNNGIDMLFPKTFDIKEYVHYIEQVIQQAFYTNKLRNLSYIEEEQNVDILTMKKRIKELEEKQILHSVVTIKLSDIKHDNLSTFIRKEDFVAIDKNANSAFFVLINLLPENARQIIADRTKVNKQEISIQHKAVLTELPET
jgi:hypothetical protein